MLKHEFEVPIGNLSKLVKSLRERGGSIVQFETVFSCFVVSERRKHFVWVPKGGSAVARSLPYSLMTALCGWWSLNGIFWTFAVLPRNLFGGTDATAEIRRMTDGRSIDEIERSVSQEARGQNLKAVLTFIVIVIAVVVIVKLSV